MRPGQGRQAARRRCLRPFARAAPCSGRLPSSPRLVSSPTAGHLNLTFPAKTRLMNFPAQMRFVREPRSLDHDAFSGPAFSPDVPAARRAGPAHSALRHRPEVTATARREGLAEAPAHAGGEEPLTDRAPQTRASVYVKAPLHLTRAEWGGEHATRGGSRARPCPAPMPSRDRARRAEGACAGAPGSGRARVRPPVGPLPGAPQLRHGPAFAVPGRGPKRSPWRRSSRCR